MNYITHLRCFFRKVAADTALNPSHISLYMALFQQWNQQRFRNPLSVARDEVMALSKINSRVTYHKCIRELHRWGYLQYDPSFNHFRGSLVYMFALDSPPEAGQPLPEGQNFFCTGAEQEVNRTCTGSEQELSPSINNRNRVNQLNNPNGGAPARAEQIADNGGAEKSERKEKGCAEKEKKGHPWPTPTLAEVRQFFRAAGYRELEGERFFHHYSANGWRIGPHPMQDWQAAAHKWVRNAYSAAGVGGPVREWSKEERDYAAPL